MTVRIAAPVADALRDGRPVVALESTVFSRLGLPPPHNGAALDRCLRAVRAGGATPAVTAVIDGEVRVGVDPEEHDRILGSRSKMASRDVPVAVARCWPVGVTTVSAALAIAAQAGIRVFATGGIGGVHRGASATGDISADLPALARYPVVTVCAGAKAFLDLPRTLEHLETLGVPVLGYGTDEFPAFHARSSGLPVPHRVDRAAEVAAVVEAAGRLGYGGGVLVVVPVPETVAVPDDVLRDAVAEAERAAADAGVSGPAVTPFVLEQIARVTGGASVKANIALAEQNAAVAAAIAGVLARS